jgi:hypothetical protein
MFQHSSLELATDFRNIFYTFLQDFRWVDYHFTIQETPFPTKSTTPPQSAGE